MGYFDDVDLDQVQQRKRDEQQRQAREEARSRQEWDMFINQDVPLMIKEFVQKAKEATAKRIIETQLTPKPRSAWQRLLHPLRAECWPIFTAVHQSNSEDWTYHHYIDIKGNCWVGTGTYGSMITVEAFRNCVEGCFG